MPFLDDIDDDNPYAAPKAENLNKDVHLDAYPEAWRDGKTLVVRKEAELLDRCLKCATRQKATGTGSVVRCRGTGESGFYLFLSVGHST